MLYQKCNHHLNHAVQPVNGPVIKNSLRYQESCSTKVFHKGQIAKSYIESRCERLKISTNTTSTYLCLKYIPLGRIDCLTITYRMNHGNEMISVLCVWSGGLAITQYGITEATAEGCASLT